MCCLPCAPAVDEREREKGHHRIVEFVRWHQALCFQQHDAFIDLPEIAKRAGKLDRCAATANAEKPACERLPVQGLGIRLVAERILGRRPFEQADRVSLGQFGRKRVEDVHEGLPIHLAEIGPVQGEPLFPIVPVETVGHIGCLLGRGLTFDGGCDATPERARSPAGRRAGCRRA